MVDHTQLDDPMVKGIVVTWIHSITFHFFPPGEPPPELW